MLILAAQCHLARTAARHSSGHILLRLAPIGTGGRLCIYFKRRDWSQQQKLTASDGAANDFFGYLSGAQRRRQHRPDRGILAKIDDNPYQGAAYIFVVSGATWSRQQKLTASDGEKVMILASQ